MNRQQGAIRGGSAALLLFLCASAAAQGIPPAGPKKAPSKNTSAPAAVSPGSGVRQEDWARALIRHLPYRHDAEAVEMAESEIFTLLSGRGEGEIAADTFPKSLFPAKKIASDDLTREASGWVEALEQPTTLYYFVPIPVSGPYFLKVRAKGPTKQYWNFQGEDSIRPVQTRGAFSWIELPPFTLQAGIKKLGASIPKGAGVQTIQYAGPCGPQVAPRGGWQPGQTISYAEMLRTLFMAYVSVSGNRLKDRWPADKKLTVLSAGPRRYLPEAKGGGRSLYQFALPAEGVYSIYALARSPGKRSWKINQCGRVESEGAPAKSAKGEPPPRRPVSTQYFPAGMLTLEGKMAQGLVADLLLIEKKDDRPEALADLARELGLPAEADFSKMFHSGKDAFAPIFQPVDGFLGPPPAATPAPANPAVEPPDNPVRDGDRHPISPMLP